jgi:hypothetical protein
MPYRDDQAILEARRNELRRELDEAARKVEALADASADKERLTRELSEVEGRLERAKHARPRLPMLDELRVASPCNVSWDAMTGDDRVRFCGSCEKNVYNLSSMPREEAEALLAKHESSVCVRFYRRADGTVLTADCPVGVRRKRLRRGVLAVAGAGALAAAATAAFAHQGKPVHVVMGEPVADDRFATRTMGRAVIEPAVMGSAAIEAPPAPKPPSAPVSKGRP